MRDDDFLGHRLIDERLECIRTRMAHDHDAAWICCERLLELLDHLLRRPGRELLVELIDAQRLRRRRRTRLPRQRRPVAGIAAHLHVDRDARRPGASCAKLAAVISPKAATPIINNFVLSFFPPC